MQCFKESDLLDTFKMLNIDTVTISAPERGETLDLLPAETGEPERSVRSSVSATASKWSPWSTLKKKFNWRIVKSRNEIIHNPKSKTEVLESFATTNESKPSKMVFFLASEIQSAGFSQAHSNTSPNFMLGVSWSWVFALLRFFSWILTFFPLKNQT